MKRYIISYLIIMGMIISTGAKAQLNPMQSQYFQNPYLVNPAMAGYQGTANIFANYANQWNKIAGAPVLMSLSISSPITDKASLGFNYITDKTGLIRKNQAMGTFAYKVELNEDNNIRFGVSLSWAQNRFDQGKATANSNGDPAIGRYNEQQSYLDGNFGVAYVGKHLEAQFSYLNLNQKRQNQYSTVDYSTFYSAISYKINLDQSNVFTAKPLVALRGIKGYTNQWDAGAEWGISDLKLYTMYHSNQSFSGGFGFTYQKKLLLSGIFTTEPNGLQGLTGGLFDLVIGYHF